MRKRRRNTRRRPRTYAFEPLEGRLLLAVLTNGLGDGMVSLQVNEQGAFGRSDFLDVSGGIPEENDVGDAIYNPVGDDLGIAGTTYTSGLAIGFQIGTNNAFREFLTAGTIAGTGNNINGLFDENFQTDLQRTSTFFYPNDTVDPAEAILRFDLVQRLIDLSFQGTQSGTNLVQSYTITNLTGSPLDFDLIRYWDGDLFEEAGKDNDGGGKDVFEVTRQLERVFMTATATGTQLNDPTFITVQNSPDAPGVLPLPRNNRWEVFSSAMLPTKETNGLLTRIVAGDPLTNEVVPASNDTSPENDIVDFGRGADYAIALRNEFEDILAPFEITFETQFGNPRIGTPPPPPPTRITGVKWADLDADGAIGPDEPTVSGWTIFLDDDGDGELGAGERSAVTGPDGSYTINVEEGDYTVAEVPRANWTQTFPANGVHEITIETGDTEIADFGNDPDPGSIRGTKWNDENNNASRDANEPGLPGWTIYVDGNNNGILDGSELSTVTGSDGSYEFPVVEFGSHRVREVQQADYNQTFPAANGGHSVFVGAGQAVSGVNFGNRLKDGAISGLKFNDLNGDGVRDPNEPGVGDFVIYADLDNDGEIGLGEPADITAANGTYVLAPLRPGTYAVREKSTPAWVQSFPADNDPNIVEVNPGVTTSGVLFGNTVAFDYGDAPAPYPTLDADGGARHGFTSAIFLGASIDFEPNGQPEDFALGDDLAGLDDEDGVVLLTELRPGQNADIEVTASDDGVLVAWIDYNMDGDWADPGEEIFSDVILADGVNALSFAVPATAIEMPTFARFRFSQQFDLSFTGSAMTGEVEDYRVFIGDPPLPAADAVDDTFTVEQDSVDNALNVLANDTTAAGTLTIVSTGSTSDGGDATVTAGLLYSPAAGFVGTETFTYTVTNGLGGMDTATVMVDVTAAVANPFNNPLNPQDVNGDTFVSPIDALLIINDLNAKGARELPSSSGAPDAPAGMVDVNGDSFISPLDALLIINHLNEQSAAGQGESESLDQSDAGRASMDLVDGTGGTSPLVRTLSHPFDLPVAATRGLDHGEVAGPEDAEDNRDALVDASLRGLLDENPAALLSPAAASLESSELTVPDDEPADLLDDIASDVAAARIDSILG